MPTQESIDRKFIQQSIRMAVENVKQQQGGPFAAIIVRIINHSYGTSGNYYQNPRSCRNMAIRALLRNFIR